ncbi:MAG: hypothetical protein H0X29_07480 [Parachlamydiaceae bacterium]|nr:hypothetical protein [Parachlamydiaceae bacterium]
MYKAALLAEKLAIEYSQNKQKQFPKIVWKAPAQGIGESYSTSYEKGIIQVQAESPLGAAYGIAQLNITLAGDHLGDFLGLSQPRFALRPLWIGCDSYVSSNGIGIALPRYMATSSHEEMKINSEKLFHRIIELGYNTILLGSNHSSTAAVSRLNFDDVYSELNSFIQLAHDFGLKVIVKPCFFSTEASKKISHCPLSPLFRGHLIEQIELLYASVSSMDYLFWESSLLCAEFIHDTFARDATLSELVVSELHLLESSLKGRSQLIYYIPTSDLATAHQHAVWLPGLCDEAQINTIISFSAVAGDCYADHLPPHPFWEKLRSSPDISATRLLPIVNAGLISQGEGLWPTLAVDLIDKYYSRLYRHRFVGVLALTNALPQRGGMLDCSLWIAGQALWRNLSPSSLSETWFAAFRPDWYFEESGDIMSRMRQIAIKLSFLRSLNAEANSNILAEDCRIMTDHILTNLRDIKLSLEKIERKQVKKRKSPTCNDYVQVFSRDAQRIVVRFLQSFNLSSPFAMEEVDLRESFWTQLSSGSGQGIRSAGKILFCDEPRRGAPGSAMEGIYLENRFL